jgi:hypothetical protein
MLRRVWFCFLNWNLRSETKHLQRLMVVGIEMSAVKFPRINRVLVFSAMLLRLRLGLNGRNGLLF